MKKIALFLMAAFAVMACEEKFVPHVDFTPAEVTIPTAGTENLETPITFTFNPNAAWTATLTGEGVSEWLSISPKSGVAGEGSIKFAALANTTKENRTAVLEIAVEGLEPVLVNVKQLQKNAIDVNAESTYAVSFKGGNVEFEVGHNVGYTYDVTGGEGWVAETKAYTTDKLTFAVAAQEINAPARTATVTVYSELGVVSIVTIAQEAWSPIVWSNSLTEMGAQAGRVSVAAAGNYVFFTANGEVWMMNEATGEGAQKVSLPEGFVAGGVHVDDAGNVLISTPDLAPGAGQLQVYRVDLATMAPTLLIDYNSANYWCTEMGNIRVKGDVTKNAVVTAYICVGTGHSIIWEINNGVVADPKYLDLHDGSWDASTGVVAPAGATVADGFFAITYGVAYNLNYYDGSTWTETYVTGSSWMENYNCISTTEINGVKYLALTASCHFDYDMTDLIVLNVTDPKAATLVFNIQIKNHTNNAAGLTYSDVYIKGENGKLAAYVIDPWMDTVDKYLFPLQ